MKNKKVITILSVLIGTILEWYDFALIGSIAPIIADLFFPSKFKILSLLVAFSVFATGFIMRPIGGLIFGHIGDRYGRRSALSMTIILMAFPTTIIGLLPTYQTIGVIAPLCLLTLRLVQGLASSGEYPGAICFLTEIAPPDKKGLWGSISMLGVLGGVMMGSLINAALLLCISNKQMHEWGWRIPFLLGLPLGIVGWYLRYKVQETEIFLSMKKNNRIVKYPVKHVIHYNLYGLFKTILVFSLSTISFYMGYVYMGAYLVSINKITFNIALLSNTIGIITLIIFIVTFGWLSDKISRNYILVSGIICLLIFFYPIFNIFLAGFSYSLIIGQVFLALYIGMLAGPLAAITAEMFETESRYTGIALSLNLGASIFGGTCPLIAVSLVNFTNNELSPVSYPIVCAIMCLLTLFIFKKKDRSK